jgi:hypothetical protein
MFPPWLSLVYSVFLFFALVSTQGVPGKWVWDQIVGELPAGQEIVRVEEVDADQGEGDDAAVVEPGSGMTWATLAGGVHGVLDCPVILGGDETVE